MESNNIKKVVTLCMVYQHPRMLLGMKKRGFGMGKWNGFGGKLDPGETIEQAAKREVLEEAGIVVDVMEKVGVIEFHFLNNPEPMEVHIFKAENFKGEPVEGEEMKPQWFDVDKLPLDIMWSDDKYWLPLFLAGKKFKGKFYFGSDNIKIIKHELEEVSVL